MVAIWQIIQINFQGACIDFPTGFIGGTDKVSVPKICISYPCAGEEIVIHLIGQYLQE